MTAKQDAADARAEAKEAKQLAADQADQAAAAKAAAPPLDLSRGIPGDATKEEIDELLLKDFKARAAAGGETVTITQAQALLLCEKAGIDLGQTEETK